MTWYDRVPCQSGADPAPTPERRCPRSVRCASADCDRRGGAPSMRPGSCIRPFVCPNWRAPGQHDNRLAKPAQSRSARSLLHSGPGGSPRDGHPRSARRHRPLRPGKALVAGRTRSRRRNLGCLVEVVYAPRGSRPRPARCEVSGEYRRRQGLVSACAGSGQTSRMVLTQRQRCRAGKTNGLS